MSVVTSETKVVALSDVIETELGNGEAVLLHLGTQSYYSLNQTALHMWNLMKQGFTLQQVSGRIQGEFDIDGDSSLKSVIELTSQLIAEELIGVDEG